MYKPFIYCILFALTVLGTGCIGNENKGEQMVNLEELTDDPEAKLTSLNAAITNSRQNAGLYARRGVLYLQQQELDKALADANEAVRLSKNEPANLFVKAQVLRALNREGEALSLALQAERNGFQNAMLYILLSDLYLRLQQPDKARQYSNLAYKLSPSDEFVLYYRGRVAAIKGDTTEAVKHYKLATEQASEFFEPLRELAGVYVAGKDFVTAQSFIDEALKQKNKDALLWYYQGRLYQGTEKTDSALWSYHKAIGIADTLAAAHRQIGYLYYTRGNYNRAITHLVKVAGHAGETARLLSTLASSYERTGQYERALEQYEKMSKMDQSHPYANKSIAKLRSKGITTTRKDSTAVLDNIEE